MLTGPETKEEPDPEIIEWLRQVLKDEYYDIMDTNEDDDSSSTERSA